MATTSLTIFQLFSDVVGPGDSGSNVTELECVIRFSLVGMVPLLLLGAAVLGLLPAFMVLCLRVGEGVVWTGQQEGMNGSELRYETSQTR